MHLKRLELYGFKSFADRTELEFKPGITAVVGPNGSGKSNISDAILWVLGEQNIRHLRGEGAQDVIFAGTDRRRPLGMAEVTLCLDNSSGVLPVDFTEVTVTRRIYRSGESEFLINRSPCRLRDIYELFLDTGVGRDAYSIIGQNQIDAVLSARGEERRQLFEEAAGVKKYRHRRREAERKLDATRQNLTRVADIIAEVESQIAPIAQQAEVAQRYNALSARLRDLELSLLAAEVRRYRAELERLSEEKHGVERQVRELDGRTALMEAEEQRLKLSVAELERCADECRAGCERAREDLLKAEARLALRRQQADSARAEQERIREELRRLDERLSLLVCEVERIRADLLQERGLLAECEQAVREAVPELQRTQQEFEKAQAALDAARRWVSKASEQRAELTQRVRALELRIADREEQARKELERRKALEAELAAAEVEAGQLARQWESCRAAVQELESELRRNEELLQEARQKLSEAQRREREVQQVAMRRALRLKSLQEMHENLEGTYRGVRAVLQAAKSGVLGGGGGRSRYRLVADLLGVPEQYRVAIEVALGSHAQDIVTQTDLDAQTAIAFLKQRNFGRATFLPLDLLRPDKMRAVRGPGVVGVASDLVYYPRDAAKAVEVLLGRVLVVQDLPTAVRLMRQSAVSGVRMVTLDGELVAPTGSITGGSREQTAGILSRKLEIDRLEQEVAEDAETLKREEQLVKEAQVELEALQSKVEDQRSQAAEQRLALARLETAVEHASANVRRLQAQMSAGAVDNRDQLERERALLEQMRQELEQVLTEHAAAEAEEVRARNEVIAVQDGLDAARTAASELRLREASARERVAALEQALRRAQESLAEAEAERLRLTEDLVNSERMLNQGRSDIDALVQEVESLRQTVAAAEERVRQVRDQRAAVLEKLAELSLRVKQASGERAELAEALRRVEVREATVRSDLAHVESRLVQEYEMDPETAVASVPPPERGTTAEANRLRAEMAAMGTVNLGAIEEHRRLVERLEFLTTQRRDLEEAEEGLRRVIAEIDEATKETFYATYRKIEASFDAMFRRLFGGGRTQLVITDPDNLLETGIDIIVQPPGKKLQHLQLLSGGEKALTAVALLFALLDVKPSPFCLLDEVDAALDEANVERFAEVVKDFAARSQFIIITHNKATMSAADTLCGVTMEEPGVSKVISIRLEDYSAFEQNASANKG
ncbi:MAG: chromosome segregation protein SMC [Armatimonadota bacterium]